MSGAAGLTAADVALWLRTGRLGRAYHHYRETDSTQELARAAAAAGAAEGALFVAETQTAGRGRQGHRWESVPGAGIYCSVLLRPRGAPAALLPLTLLAGLAVADAVRAVAGVEPDLRWPNDLLLRGRKFCGILVEMSSEGDRLDHAVVGIGINTGVAALPPGLSTVATSLAAQGYVVDRAELLAAVMNRLESRYFAWVHAGPAATLAEFEQRSRYGRALEVRVGNGSEAYTGTTAGLDANGFLLVRRADGRLVTVINGEVRPLH